MNWGRFLTEYGKGNAGVPTKAYYNDYWKAGENEDAYYPNPTGNGLAVSDRLIEDGSYIRLQNVTLRYNFPNNTLKSINKMSFYVSGNNLLLLSKYTGYDPEVSAYGQNLLRAGIDQGNYPRPRLITIGLDLSF
jgi:TonB-dependent starch-binding outer membrane protein SusC